MNLPQEAGFTSDPSEILLKHLTVRPVGRHEREAAQRWFEREHYLGAVRSWTLRLGKFAHNEICSILRHRDCVRETG